MGEIKGQLLGIVLVLAIFGVISAALITAFTNVTEDVVSKVENTTEITQNPSAMYSGLMTFKA